MLPTTRTGYAGEDLSQARGLALYQDAADGYRLKVCDDQTKALSFVGICDGPGVDDDTVKYVRLGEAVMAKAGAVIPGGLIPLTVDASGQLIEAVSTNIIVGYYVPEKPDEANPGQFLGASGAGETIRVEVNVNRLALP